MFPKSLYGIFEFFKSILPNFPFKKFYHTAQQFFLQLFFACPKKIFFPIVDFGRWQHFLKILSQHRNISQKPFLSILPNTDFLQRTKIRPFLAISFTFFHQIKNVSPMGSLHCQVAVLVSDEKLNCFHLAKKNCSKQNEITLIRDQ